MAFSHSTSVGDSAFRIRIEDTEFNNLNVEVSASESTVHKFGAYLYRDTSSNGVHFFSYTLNGGKSTKTTYGFSSTVSASRGLFVFYEVRIESVGQQWTSDFIVAEYLNDL